MMAEIRGRKHLEFARRVRDRRKALKMPQAELARLIGRDQAFISNLEHATLNPRLDAILGLAMALDTEIMLVPRRNVAEVEALLGRPEPSPTRVSSVLDDLLIPDPEDDDDHA